MDMGHVIAVAVVTDLASGDAVTLTPGERVVEMRREENWIHRSGISFCGVYHEVSVDQGAFPRTLLIMSETAHPDAGAPVVVSPWPPGWLVLTAPAEGLTNGP